MGESKSAGGRSAGTKREAGKADSRDTKRVELKSPPLNSASPVPDLEHLDALSTEKLIDLMVDIAEVLRERTSKDTEKISSPLKELSFPETNAVEVQDFVRLPVSFKKDPADVANKTWRIMLISSRQEHKPLGLEVCDDAVIGRYYLGEAEPDLDLRKYGGEDLGVSRQHAIFRPSPEGLFLADLGSTNGTYHNGDRVKLGEPQKLKDNDAISFGELHFKVRIVRQPEKSTD